jgi:hypothetical protein
MLNEIPGDSLSVLPRRRGGDLASLVVHPRGDADRRWSLMGSAGRLDLCSRTPCCSAELIEGLERLMKVERWC